MDSLINAFFRFPGKPEVGYEFVKPILNSATVPIIGIDRRMSVQVANLQAEEMLLRAEVSVQGGRRQAGAALPPGLKRSVGACLKQSAFRVLPGRQVPGLIGGTCDLLIAPGRVRGLDLAFLVMLNSGLGDKEDPDEVLDRLVSCFRLPLTIIDRDLRFFKMNKPYLAAFGLSLDEAIGRKVSELNPSKQAQILETQICHMMETCQVRDSEADRLTTAKRGVMLTGITAWPLCDVAARCLGLAVLARPVAAGDLEAALSETQKEIFGNAAVFAGPPMFLTHLDGRIIVANAAARNLMDGYEKGSQPGMALAIRWTHPEIIEKMYEDMIKGSDYSAVLTGVDTPDGTRLFRITAYGLKEIGDITSEVLFHMVDVTDTEHIKDRLAETARNLVTEKEILDHVIDNLPVTTAYAIVDRELRILRVSKSVTRSFGLDYDYFVGKKAEDVDESVRKSGIIGYIKTAMDRGQDVHVRKFPYTVPSVGREVLISLSFYPIRVGEQPACLIAVQNVGIAEQLQADLDRKSRLCETLFNEVEDAVAVVDSKGFIIDVNPVVTRLMDLKREDIIGRQPSELLSVEEKDLLPDFRRRAMLSRKPVRTGCLRLTGTVRGSPIFVDMVYVPMIGADGAVENVVVIVRPLTGIKELEQRIEHYTENLEKLVRERTQELSDANALLGGTVDRLASMAQSGMVLSSLKDTDSVMASFLKEARDVLDADFVSVALAETHDGSSKTTYYSSGDTPSSGEVPSEVIESSLARLTLGNALGEEVRQPKPNLLTVDFALARHHGLMIAWKRAGEFTAIDNNLGKLLCTQLGFSLPITSYVADLRLERDRSQILRRIAFRVAGISSVSQGIITVAEELSKTISADRFYWVVSDNDSDIWTREVYRAAGKPAKGRRHLGADASDCLRPIMKACSDSHKRFCDRFPKFGREDFVAERVRTDHESCPFALEQESGVLSKCMKELLRSMGLLGPNGGSLILAPVMLSRKSWGMICAYNEVGTPFSTDDSCFMCLAAATVGRMWEAADAASSLRRLEATGETVSELAHDLKYPLMRMRELISNIVSCDPQQAGKGPAFGGIRDEIDHLALLAQELIDISNSGGRKYELVDVADVLNHCVSLTAANPEAGSVKIKTRLDSDLPPVFASKKDVKTVLLNILANCIEAAGESGWVEVRGEYERTKNGPGCVKVTFEDSGPGVTEADRERIFDPFYTSKEGGSGIGLFSAKKRARANGGDVVCEESRTAGSRFVVWFPPALG